MKIWVVAALVIVLAPQDAPFNGKDLSGWKTKGPAEKSKWKVGKAAADGAKLTLSEGSELVNAEGHGVDLYSEATWGDCVIELELMVPKGSNSGVYVMGEYEVQVFDSFGKEKVGAGDMGGIYGATPPKVNASKPPGEWQSMRIEFRAPKFDADGKRTAKATFVKVELNGKLIQENIEMNGPTPAGVTGKEAAKGPILFQGDHGAVAYRAIKVSPLK